MHERIADMKEAEANGAKAKTITMPNGSVATELSAAQYEAVIPSFDKWLEMQKEFSAFDMSEQGKSMMAFAERNVDHLEKALNPDASSNVRSVFSDGDEVVAMFYNDGHVASYKNHKQIQTIVKDADAKGLTGQQRVSCIQDQIEAKVASRNPDIHMKEYDIADMPSRRELSNMWFPNHNVEESYDTAMKEALQFLQERREVQAKQNEGLRAMRDFLIRSMEEMQNAQS